MTVSAPDERRAVRQLRLVVEAADYDEAVHFYRDVLGLEETPWRSLNSRLATTGGVQLTIFEELD
jgi:catechol 2,3-dioxygenase-like lactoylglutathione lyase family enzyme